MNTLVKMQFGSHVYGTNTPSSDTDYKALYLPEPRDIILGRVKETILNNTKKSSEVRNGPEDVDLEIFTIKRYIELLLQGQTVAVDMLFTPSSFYTETPHLFWQELQENRHKFLHSGYSSFVGYCKQQANKYGIKGSRVNAVRNTLEYLKEFEHLLNPHVKLMHAFDAIKERVEKENNEHCKIIMLQNAQKNGVEPYLEVCNRKIPFHANFKYAISALQKIFDEYGARALQAEKQEGVDWKALMHAVRIANQSKEFLLTGNIIFPRPEKNLLLQIRKGELPYKQVAEMIENGLVEIEEAAKKSILPAQPDLAFAEDFIYRCYESHLMFELFKL